MTVCAILGGQWGDEGKGKIVDFVAEHADVTARFSGGNNAGHTVMNPQGTFKLHLVPSGIFWPEGIAVVGNGVVIDPGALLEEIDALKARGIDLDGKLLVSDRSHLVMPYHVKLDELAEKAKGDQAIGTTGKGIGPAYIDKAARTGIRAADLLDLEALYPRLEAVLSHHNAVIEKVYEDTPLKLDAIFESCKQWASQLAPYIGPVEHIVYDAAEAGKRVIIEGAQGMMLDLDHGTYPFVTSSHPTIGGACIGLGLLPSQIDVVLGVFKAYSTRVGSGPFLTESFDETGERIRNLANEFGTTTGRPRRVGWFDSVVARYSTRINGYTSLVLTRLDVLDDFGTIKICDTYELDGELVKDFPGSAALLERCKPIYEDFPGWDGITAGVTKMEDLPTGARAYVERLEELIGRPFDIISTGPYRHETILVRDIF
ncbi:MAG: adenylosuccinate synthase [SAR202 cluster bacterium]|jgi:adenylosuccinate synthase|nr:adenylosuccinate synthase [SAR202 cluster bacterium]